MNGFLWIISITASLAQADPGYRIKGKIENLDDNVKIYLHRGMKRIDSASVENGEFVLKGRMNEPAFTYVFVGKGKEAKKIADVLLDNRDISITGAKPDYDYVTVSGSDIDQQWRDWYDQDKHISSQQSRLNKERQTLINKQDTANANALSQQIDKLMNDRITLLKSCVKRWHDSPSGAVLPTLCTLQTRLSRADYLEMYGMLTPKMQSTAMGREIVEQANKAKLIK